MLAVTLGATGCGGFGMPRATPLAGQTAETMARDRRQCEDIAKTEIPGSMVHLGLPYQVGGSVGSSSANTPVVDKQGQRQREHSFSSCMRARGYQMQDEP